MVFVSGLKFLDTFFTVDDILAYIDLVSNCSKFDYFPKATSSFISITAVLSIEDIAHQQLNIPILYTIKSFF